MEERNNYVELIGTISGEANYDHESYGEKFYRFIIGVKRQSGTLDYIPILISKELYNINNIKPGLRVKILGEYRSYNLHENNRNRLLLNVFATGIEETDIDADVNSIILSGYICKKPSYRKTPLGREITDIMLAVNRVNGKSDYLPLVSWGRVAKNASQYPIGESIKIKGRIQSREYTKVLDGNMETRTAYEVSVNTVIRNEKIFQANNVK